jgi:hypothetical protein
MLRLYVSRRYMLEARELREISGRRELLERLFVKWRGRPPSSDPDPRKNEGIRQPVPKLWVTLCAPLKPGRVPFRTIEFTLDTGADMMVIPVSMAAALGIDFSRDIEGKATTIKGSVRCYYDVVTVKSTLSGKVHRWPCCFVETTETRMLIGRAGFLADFAVSIRNGQLIVMYPVSLFRFLGDFFTARFRRSASRDPI